ncbi:putative G-protein coupled receptor 133 [Stylophora pistillata]|uniref:Putative G-protein coupled receptor 133 n=1 Tax=Stylophora pistillata TaxID=50429 RepID=A0A2B4S3R4_STYPI|nr:putative G-protein coupled receptor 133 [Stylophora pistillata]
MPTDKPTNWSSALIPGNGPGSTSKEYLTNQSPRCIGGSGHGGRGGNPAYDDIQVYLYSGLEYGRNDYEVLLGGSSGSYLDSSALTITKPGHGGGALQLVAKQGSIIIEEKIKANAQQTKGQYEVNSGSSGGLIRLEANEVRIINAGSLEVNGAHAGKNGNTSPVWEKGSAGGAGGIVDILANKVFIATGSILLMPGNSTGCVNQTTASPGFLTIRDHSCNLRISWRNIPVFPADPAGFTWTNTTLLPPSSIPSSIAVAIQTQPSVEISTNDSPFIVTSSLPAKRESSTTASITNIYERQSKMHTSSAGVKTSFSRNGLSSTKRIQCSTDVKPVTATLSTDAVFASSPPRADIRVTRKWEDLLTSVEYLTVSIGSSRNNSWADDVYNLLQRLRTLVEEEPLTERHLNVFLKILQQFGMALSMIPSEHQETMKNIVTSLITTAESSFEKRNEQVWSTTEKLPTVLSVLENITLALWRITSVNEPFKFEHYSQRTVVQVVSLKPTRKKSVTHFMLPDISRTNQSIWKNEHNAVLIPSFNDGVVVVVSTILYRNISSIHPTTFKENRNESAWSTEGIKTAQVDGTQARCHTTHLTSFAILTQYTEVQISAEDEFVLGIITYVGCGVSIACLFATLLVYLAFESLSTERHKIHMNLALALLLAQSLFLTGVNAIGHKTLCRVLAVCLHYLFSAVFTWMCVEGFHLYVMILSVFRADSVKMKYYYLTGWGIPVIIVGLAASIHPEGYGTIKSCWLSIHDQFIWVFLAPVVLVIVVNFMVLVAVIKVVANSALPSRANTDFGNVKAGVKSAVVLLPLLGVSWVFGLLTLNEKMIAFQYIFAFSTSFQVRSAFKRMRQRHMWARGSENAPSHIPSKVNVPVSNGIISKGNILEQKEKIRASVFSQTNSKVVKVKPPKDNFEGACLQINRTYQMSRRETTESKDCSKMTSLNCPQGAVSPKESPKRRYSSKLS